MIPLAADGDERIDDDAALVRRAQAGCRRSFEALVKRYQAPLLRFLSQRVRSLADAEDLLQETFVRAYQRLDRYRDAWRFSTWLYTIAHRLSVSHHRRSQSRPTCGPEPLASRADASAPEPGHDLAEGESRRRFWDAAATVLTDEQLAAVWLFYVEGMGAREVAAVLDKSWVSVKTMLFRARRRLEPCARELEGDCAPDDPPAVLSRSPALHA